MAWVKIPAENHPLFLDAVPADRRVTTVKMFGGICGMVNGNMFGGLFARSVIVRLSPEDQKRAMKLDGTQPFDPMGNGRVMTDTLLLPEDVMDDRQALRGWLQRALDFTATLPKKARRDTKPSTSARAAPPVAAARKTKAKAKPKAKPRPKSR